MNRIDELPMYDAYDMGGNLVASGSASLIADVLGLSCSYVKDVAIEKRIVETSFGLMTITRV